MKDSFLAYTLLLLGLIALCLVTGAIYGYGAKCENMKSQNEISK